MKKSTTLALVLAIVATSDAYSMGLVPDWPSEILGLRGAGYAAVATFDDAEAVGLFQNPAVLCEGRRRFVFLGSGNYGWRGQLRMIGLGQPSKRISWGIGWLQFNDKSGRQKLKHLYSVSLALGFRISNHTYFGFGLIPSHFQGVEDFISFSLNPGINSKLSKNMSAGVSVRNAASVRFNPDKELTEDVKELARQVNAGINLELPKYRVRASGTMSWTQRGDLLISLSGFYQFRNIAQCFLGAGSDGVVFGVNLMVGDSKIGVSQRTCHSPSGRFTSLRHSFGKPPDILYEEQRRIQATFDTAYSRAQHHVTTLQLDSAVYRLKDASVVKPRNLKVQILLTATEIAADSLEYGRHCYESTRYYDARRCFAFVQYQINRELVRKFPLSHELEFPKLDSLQMACKFYLQGESADAQGLTSQAVEYYWRALDFDPEMTGALAALIHHEQLKCLDVEFSAAPRVFAANYRSYATVPICSLFATNPLADTLKVIIDFEWSGWAFSTSQPPETTVIAPGQTKVVEFYQDLPSIILDIPTTRDMPLTAKLTTRYSNLLVSHKTETMVRIYARNTVTWNEPDRVAAFINPEDPEIRLFSSRIMQLVEDSFSSEYSITNIQRAMAIFNYLNIWGLKYLPDPTRPFDRVEQNTLATDNVQYPADLLESLSGDCDDLSVLMCALLESIGIETAIVDVPGHLFMMFDAGVPVHSRLALRVEDDLIAKFKDKIFVPLEMTALDSSFIKAWKYGAAEYHSFQSLGKLHAVHLKDAWAKYEPVPYPKAIMSRPFDMDEFHMITDAELEALQEICTIYEQRWDKDIGNIQQRQTAEALNDSALVEIFQGNMDKGEGFLQRARNADKTHQGVINNSANLSSCMGRCLEALDRYGLIGDTTYLIDEVLYNIIITKCLALDAGQANQKTRLLEFVLECSKEYGFPKDFTALQPRLESCMHDTMSEAEAIAGCMVEAFRGRPPNTEKAEHPLGKVEWFKWYGKED